MQGDMAMRITALHKLPSTTLPPALVFRLPLLLLLLQISLPSKLSFMEAASPELLKPRTPQV